VKRALAPHWHYYIGLFRSVWGRLLLGLVFLVLQSFLYVPIVWLVRSSFDVALPNDDWNAVMRNGLLAVGLLVVNTAMGIWARSQAMAISEVVIATLRGDLLKRLLSFSRQRYTAADLPRLQHSIIVESDRLEAMNYVVFTQMLPGAIGALVLGGVLAFISLRLLLVLLLLIPALAWLAQAARRFIHSAFQNFQRSISSLSVATQTLIRLLDLIHMQSSEEAELHARQRDVARVSADSQRLWFAKMLYTETQSGLIMIAVLATFIFGSREVILGRTTAGELAAYYVVLGLLANVLRPIWGSFPHFVTGLGSIKQLHKILADPDQLPYRGRRLLDFHGNLRMENVSFRFGALEVLKDFSINLRPGRRVAVVGPNGAGKTSVVHLLLGFYRPSSGRLVAEGVEYDTLDLVELRRNIGLVAQHVLLWPGTIWENLVYGNEGVQDAEAREVSRLAGVQDFVETLPKGYDTVVGENGILLSGGQRQRLSIARALMRHPKLLIFDEPTNHLDRESADRLLRLFSTLPQNPAILFITHDESLQSYADEVITLQPLQITAELPA